MRAMIEIPPGIQATIENFQWESTNKQWEKILNDHVQLFRNEMPGNDPSPNVHIAMRAADYFGGKVVMEESPPYDELLVY